jgi:hypothetical protein
MAKTVKKPTVKIEVKLSLEKLYLNFHTATTIDDKQKIYNLILKNL